MYSTFIFLQKCQDGSIEILKNKLRRRSKKKIEAIKSVLHKKRNIKALKNREIILVELNRGRKSIGWNRNDQRIFKRVDHLHIEKLRLQR